MPGESPLNMMRPAERRFGKAACRSGPAPMVADSGAHRARHRACGRVGLALVLCLRRRRSYAGRLGGTRSGCRQNLFLRLAIHWRISVSYRSEVHRRRCTDRKRTTALRRQSESHQLYRGGLAPNAVGGRSQRPNDCGRFKPGAKLDCGLGARAVDGNWIATRSLMPFPFSLIERTSIAPGSAPVQFSALKLRNCGAASLAARRITIR